MVIPAHNVVPIQIPMAMEKRPQGIVVCAKTFIFCFTLKSACNSECYFIFCNCLVVSNFWIRTLVRDKEENFCQDLRAMLDSRLDLCFRTNRFHLRNRLKSLYQATTYQQKGLFERIKSLQYYELTGRCSHLPLCTGFQLFSFLGYVQVQDQFQ